VRKLRALILSGGQGHDFDCCARAIQDILTESGRISVNLTDNPKDLSDGSLGKYAVCVLYTSSLKLNKGQEKALISFVRRGGGLLALHGAALLAKQSPAMSELLGCTPSGQAVEAECLMKVRDPSHPLMRRLKSFPVQDEILKLRCRRGIRPLLETYWQGEMLPMALTNSYGEGRVFYLAPGHSVNTLCRDEVRRLLIRGCLWVSDTLADSEQDVRCAIVGYEPDVASYHARCISATGGLNLVAVCDSDPARREAAEKEIPGVELFADVRQLLLRAQFDLAVVLLPPDSRTQVALQCLRAGKHVVVAPPMSLNTKDASALISAARKKNVMLSVCHDYRWDGEFLAIEEIVSSGTIGDIFHVETFAGGYGRPRGGWRSDKAVSGGAMYGPAYDLICGMLDLASDNRVSSVNGVSRKIMWPHVTSEDHAQLMMRFDSGATADLQVSSIASIPKPRWRILGTKGGILSPLNGDCVKVVTPSSEMSVPFRENGRDAYYVNVANHLHEGEPLLVGADLGRRAISVIEAAEKSSVSGQTEKLSRSS
jgi:scyllo-inositol 2-dehydrogenase (NADP+)